MRSLLPREHGLWCWVCVPLLAALLLAPEPGSAGGALAILAVFGAGNGARRGAWAAAGWSAAFAAGIGLAVVPALRLPLVWAGTLGLLAAGHVLAVRLGAGAWGRRAPNATLLELGAIAAFAGAGVGLAVANGAAASTAALVAVTLVTWEVIGLWWVRGQLARVLPGRLPWRAGPWGIAVLVLLTIVAASALGRLPVALLPALYLVRAGTTRPVRGPRDARRIGLGEALWAGIVAVLATLAVR